ncbi:MAG: PhzF family phenazine biosynthesis protein [Myxococcota bacterium]
MAYPFVEIDVFTARPLMGNPVAVVLEAKTLETEAMARIANWTNFSETTFVTGADPDGYDVRIFTPRGELPFAGHPSVGTAFALRSRGALSKEQVTQRCAAGPVPIRFIDHSVFVRVPTPRITEVSTAVGDIAQALRASSLEVPLRINVGPVWVTARVGSLAELASLDPDGEALTPLSRELNAVGITVYAVENGRVEVRSFAPAEGIAEDPVCGSGNACVAAHLRKTGALDDLGAVYEAGQGRALGRDGRVQVRVEGDGIWIGGECTTVVAGELSPD